MATIFYGMAGEGRGHATRVRAIVEDLRQEHRVILYAPGQAYELLKPALAGTGVEVRPLDGLSFCYRPDGSLDYVRTLWESFRAWLGFPRIVAKLQEDMKRDSPQLVVTDFDPLLPRAAEVMGIPYVSIDHQHFLGMSDLSDLPFRLRSYARIMALGVRCFYGSQALTVVSSFFFPRLLVQSRVRQVGVLLGQDVRAALPQAKDDGFLLAYLRRNAPRRVVRALRNCGFPVRIYGLGNRPEDGNLCFRDISRENFVQDLASCRALVSTAGNQLVGEALYLGKPVLAMPEPGNYEQEINGFFLQRFGGGWCVPMRSLRSHTVAAFLNESSRLRSSVPRDLLCGNDAVSRILSEVLQAVASGVIRPHRAPVFRRLVVELGARLGAWA